MHTQHIPKARPKRRGATAQVLQVTDGGPSTAVLTLSPRERLHIREHCNSLDVPGAIKLYSEVQYAVGGGA